MLLITIRKRMCSLYLSAQKSATSRNIKKFCGLYLQNTLAFDKIAVYHSRTEEVTIFFRPLYVDKIMVY